MSDEATVTMSLKDYEKLQREIQTLKDEIEEYNEGIKNRARKPDGTIIHDAVASWKEQSMKLARDDYDKRIVAAYNDLQKRRIF